LPEGLLGRTIAMPQYAAKLSLHPSIGELVISYGATPTFSFYFSAAVSGTTRTSEGADMSEVTSVNGQTGVVVLTPADVEAVPDSSLGVAGGVATLGGSGKLPEGQLPSSVVSSSHIGPIDWFTPTDYGAVYDVLEFGGASMTAGSNIVTTTTAAPFTPTTSKKRVAATSGC
jgi:hypothetical protein